MLKNVLSPLRQAPVGRASNFRYSRQHLDQEAPNVDILIEEKKKVQQKIVKMRMRIATRRNAVAKIVSSMGFVIDQRNAPPPTVTLMKTSIHKLVHMKELHMAELKAILESDAHFQCEELESDVLSAYEEYLRLHDEVENIRECNKQISDDISKAKKMLSLSQVQQAEIDQMKIEIDDKINELKQIASNRSLDNVTESSLREDIMKLTSRISAEELATSQALSMVDDCCAALFKEAELARARLNMAIKTHRGKL